MLSFFKYRYFLVRGKSGNVKNRKITALAGENQKKYDSTYTSTKKSNVLDVIRLPVSRNEHVSFSMSENDTNLAVSEINFIKALFYIYLRVFWVYKYVPKHKLKYHKPRLLGNPWKEYIKSNGFRYYSYEIAQDDWIDKYVYSKSVKEAYFKNTIRDNDSTALVIDETTSPDWVYIYSNSVVFDSLVEKLIDKYEKKSKKSVGYYFDHTSKTELKFKPQFSPEFLFNSNYIGDLVVINSRFYEKHLSDNDYACVYQYLLHIARYLLLSEEKLDEFYRIPYVGYYSDLEDKREGYDVMVRESLSAQGAEFSIVGGWNDYSVKYCSTTTPKVSIIIPTRNGIDILKICIQSLIQKTDYENYEVIVIDNGSDELESLNYIDALPSTSEKIKVYKYPHEFNYSAINNFAVDKTDSEYICLLNNDTEIIHCDWLSQLVGQIQQPKVGVVGCKLLYSNGTIQHAGDILGAGGCADHAFNGMDETDRGYMSRASYSQDLSAVTAACMLVRKSIWDKLGGLEEKHLPVAFNDVDFCLRIRQLGERVVINSNVRLFHHESVSRGKDDDPIKINRASAEVNYMYEKWRSVIEIDPFYNPNINHCSPDFKPSNIPLTKKLSNV